MSDWKIQLESAIAAGKEREEQSREALQKNQEETMSTYLQVLQHYRDVIRPTFQEACDAITGKALLASFTEEPDNPQADSALSFESALLVRHNASGPGGRLSFSVLRVSGVAGFELSVRQTTRVLTPALVEITDQYVGALITELVQIFLGVQG